MTDFRSDRARALQTARICGTLAAEKCVREGGRKEDYILEGKETLRKFLTTDDLLIYEKVAEKKFVESFNYKIS